jgi:hypothetical protein
MMTSSFRLSRLNSPRATLWSAVLLIAAFIVFGVWANAAAPALSYAGDQMMAEPAVTFVSQLKVEACHLQLTLVNLAREWLQ